jgi:hypothetical protein
MALKLPSPTLLSGLAEMSNSGKVGKEKVAVRAKGGEAESKSRRFSYACQQVIMERLTNNQRETYGALNCENIDIDSCQGGVSYHENIELRVFGCEAYA